MIPVYASGFLMTNLMFLQLTTTTSKNTCNQCNLVASIESNMLKGSNLILWDDGTCQQRYETRLPPEIYSGD